MEALGLQADFIIEGTHIFAPPQGQVLMNDPQASCFERAMGFYNEELRQKFIDSSARIAGVGGGGLTLAVMLAKEGVRDFSIADVDQIDATNVGRIPLLTPDDVGLSKADVAAELIVRHNPTATVRVYKEGIQEHNVEEFLGFDAGNSGIVVGFDEIDLNEPRIALLFHRTARQLNRYVIAATDVERGGFVTTFNPGTRRHTFESFNGAKATDTESQFLAKMNGFPLPSIPNIPKNGSYATLTATVRSASLPTTLRSVLNATDLALDEFEKLLTLGDRRYGQPHFFPKVHCANPSQGEDFVTRLPRVRSTIRILKLVVRDKLGLNPPASYSDERRAARESHRAEAAGS